MKRGGGEWGAQLALVGVNQGTVTMFSLDFDSDSNKISQFVDRTSPPNIPLSAIEGGPKAGRLLICTSRLS